MIMKKKWPAAAAANLRAFSVSVSALVLAAALAGCDIGPLASAENLKSEARQTLEAKNFSDAADAARKYIDKAPEDYEGYYLLAQAKAQTGDKNAALVALEQAIKKGLKDDEQIEKNSNLDPIKSMVAYADLMKTSFPSRKVPEVGVSGEADADEAAPTVSITESDGKQLLRAGDIVIEMPADQ
jgi:tetratricopeptide (TPR) repeat protein